MSRLRTAMLSMLLIASAVIPATAVAETCANARAVDGDTIRCANGRKIRLKDVYAPELNQSGGRAAKERLGSAVNGKTFSYKPEGKSYGRDVARVPGVSQSTVGPRGGSGSSHRAKSGHRR